MGWGGGRWLWGRGSGVLQTRSPFARRAGKRGLRDSELEFRLETMPPLDPKHEGLRTAIVHELESFVNVGWP